MRPLVQKYKSAYYTCVGNDRHYMMFDGIRTQHSTKDEALMLCERTKALHDLPNVNVDKSSTFNLTRNQNVS